VPASRSRPRVRRAHRKAGLDPYTVSLASVGLFCFVTAVLTLLAQPSWDTPVFDEPLGAFLLGGLGGIVTLAASPGRARRLRVRTPARLAAITAYRLVAACLMGGLGYAVVSAASGASGLVFPGWLPAAGAAMFGILELALNDVLLKLLGCIEPGEIDAGIS